MESHWAAHFLTHPVPVLMGLGFVVVITLGLSPAHAIPPILARRQLFLGYLGIFISCIVASAWISYVPWEEALTVWKIPPENYWPSLRDEFFAQLVLLSFVSLIGSAILGVPIVMALSRRGLATVPSVLILSLAVSLLITMIFVLLGVPSPDVQFLQIAPSILGAPLLVAWFLLWRQVAMGAQTTNMRPNTAMQPTTTLCAHAASFVAADCER